jgi:hypothetical protein
MDASISRDETRRSLALWFAVLAPPVAWATQLGLAYSAEDFISCTPAGRFTTTIAGLSLRAVMVVIDAAFLAVCIAALLSALHCLRVNAAEPSGRASWMALAGVVNSVLFGLLIAVAFLPPLLFSACRVAAP